MVLSIQAFIRKAVALGSVIAATFMIPAQAHAVLYETDMGWTDTGSILLSPTTGVGPDITVSFWASTDFGTTDTVTALGYGWGSGTVDPTVVMSFSENVTDLELDIRDLDTFEALINMSPVPDAVSDALYISGDSVFASTSDIPSTLFYGLVSPLNSFEFTFDQTASNLALTNLRFEFASVPEPQTALLMATAIPMLFGFARHRKVKMSERVVV